MNVQLLLQVHPKREQQLQQIKEESAGHCEDCDGFREEKERIRRWRQQLV